MKAQGCVVEISGVVRNNLAVVVSWMMDVDDKREYVYVNGGLWCG